MSAIDHRANRIVLGVNSAATAAVVEERLLALRIPRRAVRVLIVGEAQETRGTEDSTLTNYFDPIPGGVQVSRLNAGGATHTPCTLGFNVRRWLSDTLADTAGYFVTAAHCSPNGGALDGTASYFGQPTYSSGYGGTEVVDPPFFYHDAQHPYCDPGRQCFLGDGTLYRYQSGDMGAHGKVAMTGVSSTTVTGRITIDGITEPITGYSVHMIGAVSGRTSGQVAFPCVDYHYQTSNKTRICVAAATYANDFGDSGGPVVELHGNGSTGYAVGLNFAKNMPFYDDNENLIGTYSLFSRITQLISAVWESSGYAYLIDPTTDSEAPADPSPPAVYGNYAVISGTSVAGPGMTCHFYSGSDIQDPAIQWIVDGNVVGTDADLYFSASSSYSLMVHYFNSVTGEHAWDVHEVVVQAGADTCYDQ